MARFILLRTTLALAVLVFSTGSAQASLKLADDPLRDAERADFQAAESALAQGRLQRYNELKISLRDYPLYPYLEFQELTKDLSATSSSDIARFFTRYSDTPLANRLRNIWLRHLAAEKKWSDYLEFFNPTTSISQTCRYLQALIHTGASDTALRQVEPIWLSGRSRPKSCDSVFAAWKQDGHLTRERVWARIELTLNAGNSRLAKYLGRFLDPVDQSWLDLWLQVHRNPERSADLEKLKRSHPKRNAILIHAVKRLARKNPDQALTLWQRLLSEYKFTSEQELTAERAVALAVAHKGSALDFSAIQRFEPCGEDIELHEARIRAALERQEWEIVLHWIEALPSRLQDKEVWLYWRARALSQLGFNSEAKQLFGGLANHRSYYGFLASDQLGRDYRLNHSPVQLATGKLDRLAGSDTAQRAYELYALKRYTAARSEWNWLTRNMSNEELKAAAKLAQGWGWHDRAIFTLAKTRYWDDLELRFPLEHRSWIEQQAANQGLDSAWVFAVVRQESAFLQDARSSAGALGLMQLMPRTARGIAKYIGNDLPRKRELLQPATNIKLGTAYLRKVLDTFGEHAVLATAAYNAGPHRVRGWLPEHTVPADLWIETVPFRETRGYLRRVMAYTVIYQERLRGESQGLNERMRPVDGRLLTATADSSKKEG